MKADQPTRGAQRVNESAACKKGKHGRCLMQDCRCKCHEETGK